MDYKVIGCRKCPFCNDSGNVGDATVCQHPNANNGWGGEYQSDVLTFQEWQDKPEWCPLKQESITITL